MESIHESLLESQSKLELAILKSSRTVLPFQMSQYETTCDRLDDLAMRNLRLSNDLIRLKVDLDSRLRDGWLSMAKTRFVAGFHRFGKVNLPDYDLSDPASIDQGAQIVVDLESIPIDDRSSDQKFKTTKFQARIDSDQADQDQKKVKEEMERRLLKRFGGITPGSLRQGQRTFETVLELVCEIASVESELSAVIQEYRRLSDLKDKVKAEG